jgi:hypothetical protein
VSEEGGVEIFDEKEVRGAVEGALKIRELSDEGSEKDSVFHRLEVVEVDREMSGEKGP